MKLCNIRIVSKLLVVVFLILLIVLCSFGLNDSGKYSCDNGAYMPYNFNSNMSKKCKDAYNKCSSKCNDFSKKCIECVKDNGCNELNCTEGYISNVILIVIISLTSIFLIFKIFCMFQKKGPMATM